MASDQDNDRRQAPRLTSARVAYLAIGGDPHQARLQDIAAGGVCVEVTFRLEPGEMALVELAPGRQDAQDPVRLPARIVWCTARGERFQVGAKFEPLDAPLSERLGLILADHAGDTPRSHRRPLTRVSPEPPDDE